VFSLSSTEILSVKAEIILSSSLIVGVVTFSIQMNCELIPYPYGKALFGGF
jgi:hypothetical protein